MARIPMVTRTITTTKVKALCVDIEKQTPYEDEFVLTGTFKDEPHMMKELEKTVNDETHKVVHVMSHEIVKTLYGMTEKQFIECAKVLPPRDAADVADADPTED